MTSIIVFGVSSALLAAFIGFKAWEEREGRHFFAERRARLDIRAELFLAYVRHEVPVLISFGMKIATLLALRGFSAGLKKFGNGVRHGFHQAAQMIDGKIELKKRGTASFYLREVAEHKRSLVTAQLPRPTRTI